MRNGGIFWVLALVVASAQPGRCEEEEHPPEPVGASVDERDGVVIHQAILPGELLDWNRLVDAQRGPSLVLLTKAEVPPSGQRIAEREVWLWSTQGKGDLEQVGPSLPEAASHVMATVGAVNASRRILVTAGGSILGLDHRGQWVERFSYEYDLFPVRDSRGGPAPDEPLLLRSLGSLQALEVDPNSLALRSAWVLELPLSVDREWGALRLESPPLAVFTDLGDGTMQLIGGPETEGMRRIRSTLIDVSLDSEPEVLETWNMLSSLEHVEESWYVEYEGAPALIVSTVLADKHGVFEKKKLRLFSLTADRTRAGSGPLLQALTRSRNWYGMCAGIADVNRDGLQDLVSAQPKGLGAGSLWVEAHLAKGSGSFADKPRGSEIEVEEGEVCSLAVDVTGDQTVDLVVVEDDTLLVFTLLLAPEAKAVVDAEPLFRVSFDDISDRPLPYDPVHHSPARLVVTGRTQGKRQAVSLIQFR